MSKAWMQSLFSKVSFSSKIYKSPVFWLIQEKEADNIQLNFPSIQVTSERVRSGLKELRLQGNLTLFPL